MQLMSKYSSILEVELIQTCHHTLTVRGLARKRQKLRPRLARWNISDSGLNHLEQFQTGKNQNISEVNRFETFEVFVLQPWNGKMCVSSDYDSLPSHFHWIWNVSINGPNDFTRWFWFDRESFLETFQFLIHSESGTVPNTPLQKPVCFQIIICRRHVSQSNGELKKGTNTKQE
jgi:hypothetical protein